MLHTQGSAGPASHADPGALALLASDVDALLSYIGMLKTPDVDAVREPLERSLRAAQGDIAAARAGLGPRSRALTGLLAVSAAALLGALTGAVLGRRRQKLR